MNWQNRIYESLTESAISREVKETPGSKMMLARSQITSGQYAKFSSKKKSKKHGRRAGRLIAQARDEK